MRALLVCAAPARGAVALVATLAQTSDLVIAVDGGGALCRRAHVAPDLLVGDFDSLSASALDALERGGARVVRFPAEKDDSDLALALGVARDRGATEVIVTAAASARLDHTLAALAALAAAADLSPVLIEPDVEVFVLNPAGRQDVAVRGAGSTVSLIPFGGPACASASGVRWPLRRAALDAASTKGLSNLVEDGEAVVTAHEGTLLVVLPHVS